LQVDVGFPYQFGENEWEIDIGDIDRIRGFGVLNRQLKKPFAMFFLNMEILPNKEDNTVVHMPYEFDGEFLEA